MPFAPVHARVLDGRGGCRPATPAEVARAEVDDATLWVHVDYAVDGTLDWLRRAAGLDEVTAEALMSNDPRPRSVVVGQGLLVVLRAINVNEGASPEDMVSLRMWVDARRVITLRHRRLMAVQDVAVQLDAGHGPVSPGDLLHELIDRLLDRLGQVVQQLEDNVDQLEEQVLGSGGRALRARLSELRRRAIMLRRYVGPQRDTLARLPAERVDWLDDLSRARLRESADRITRYVESMDTARERAAVASEELSNRLAEEMNRTMYTLSIVAAIFLPLGLLTGLLGINVGGIPGTESPWAFGVVTALLVVLGVAQWLWFKRRSMF